MMVMRMNENDGYVEGEVGHNRMKNEKEKEKDREIPPPPAHTLYNYLSVHNKNNESPKIDTNTNECKKIVNSITPARELH